MKIFRDKELKHEIEDKFSFGVVSVGKTKEVTLYVQNNDEPSVTGFLTELIFEVHAFDPENDAPIVDEVVEILEFPKELPPFESSVVRLSWTPNIDLEQGLKARLIVTGSKIVG